MRQKLTLILGVCCTLAGLFAGVLLVQAQTSSDWAEPVNLSQSGAATSPFMAVESDGNFHVFWQDNYADNYIYSQGQGSEWSSPISITLPFAQVMPSLLADNNGRIHAFWLDAEEETLLYSSVPISGVNTLAAWAPTQTLAETAVDLDVALDESGQLHLLYLRPDHTDSAPAGIYHQYTADGGQTWQPAVILYQSPYFRGLEAEDANVELATTTSDGRSWLFAAWDNRSRKQIFLARSNDGGASWEPPTGIAGPESGSSSVFPFGLKVGVKGNDVILVWSNGQPASLCRQFYQSSPDLGTTWQKRLQMVELLPGTGSCVSDNRFLVGSEFIFLFSEVQGQVYLWAWDGLQWSKPQPTPSLTNFDDPETLNSVVLRCRQTAVTNNQLIVVGCDETASNYNDGDIWLLSRPLASTADWFPPPSAWVPAAPIMSGPDSYDAQVLVAADSQDNHLAFWTLADVSGSGSRDIYLSYLAEGRWSLPEALLKSPEGLAGPLSAVASPAGQLYLSWGTVSGQLYLARNDVIDAHIATAWSTPQLITTTGRLAYQPALAVTEDETLYLAYTVAVNEGRGVYLLKSADNGRTWSEPVLVFDATAAGWATVGPARLAVTDDGQVHLMWSQQSLLAGNEPQTQSLYYAHSEDGGQLFSPAMMMAEGIFSWYTLLGSQQVMHQLWQAWDGTAANVQHTYSVDGGQRWGRPSLVDTIAGPIVATGNDAGQLFLLYLADTAVGEWHWNGNNWVRQGGIDLTQVVDHVGQNISAAIAANGQLTTLFPAEAENGETGETLQNLYASYRVVTESVGILPTLPISEVITVTAVITPTLPVTQTEEAAVSLTAVSPTATPETEATAVPPVNLASNNDDTAPAGPLPGIILGILPVLLLILLILGFGLRAVKLRRS